MKKYDLTVDPLTREIIELDERRKQSMQTINNSYCYKELVKPYSTIAYNSFYCNAVKLRIKNVKFQNPATIVWWEDGTKTVVKCGKGDTFDSEKGLTMAIVKKICGNKGNYYNQIKKWLPEEKEKEND